MAALAQKLRDLAIRALGRGQYVKMPSGVSAGAGAALAGYSHLGSASRQVQAYQGWISSCVNVIRDEIASLEWHLYKQRGVKDEWPEVFAHPVLDLLARPNPIMSGRRLRALMQSHLDLTGAAYALILENALRRPAELWPLLPQNLVEIKTGRDTSQIVKAFVFRQDGGQQISLDPAQVLYLSYPHPQSLVHGASPVQAQAYAYDTDLAVRVYVRNFFQNSARPDVTLETDQHLTEDDARRIIGRWKAKHAGPEHAGEPTVLDAGLKANLFGALLKDLEFAFLAGWTQDQILAAYRVPAGVLGLVKDVNRANGDAIDRDFQGRCIHPRTELWTEEITYQLAQRYDSGLWCELAHEVPRDREFEHKRDMAELEHGVITINELRGEYGRPDLAGGDVPRVASNMLPLDGLKLGDAGGRPQRAALAVVAKDSRQDLAEALGFIAAIEPWERRMKGQLAGVFRRQGLVVDQRLEAAWPQAEGATAGWSKAKVKALLKNGDGPFEPLFSDWKAWSDDLRAAAWDSLMPSIVGQAGQEALMAAGVGMSFNLVDPAVVAWLQESAATAAQVNDYTREMLRRHLRQALENGETFDQVRQRVRGVFDFCENERADTIARTEVANSRRFGTHQGYAQSGAPFLKTWVAEPGARQSHAAAALRYSGTGAITMDKRFVVGGCTTEIPGHSGCAREDINCRCHVRYTPDLGAASGQRQAGPAPVARAYSQEDCHADA